MLIILSGPPGAGKSTIADLLSKKFPKSAQFSTDTIRHFIKGGYIAPWEPGAETAKQLILADDISKEIVKKYISTGYVTILDGIFFDEDIKEYKKIFDTVKGFILLPSLEVLKERDNNRPEFRRVPHRIEPSYEKFVSEQHNLFTVLDTSDQKPQETANHIFSLIP